MNLSLHTPPRTKRRKRLMGPLLMLFCFLLAVAGGVGYLLLKVMPSTERVEPFDGRKNVVLFQGQAFGEPFLIDRDQILLPFDFIKAHLDPNAYWDEPTRSLIITTKDKVLRMESDQVTAYLNNKPVSLSVPVKEEGGVRYVPYAPLEKLYPFQLKHHPETGVLTVEPFGAAVQQGKVLQQGADDETIPMRAGASEHEPIIEELASEVVLDIRGEQNGWYHVQTENGLMGFLPKQSVELTQIRSVPGPGQEEQKPVAWKPLGSKIVLAWEHVVSKNPNTAAIAQMPGLNVVSPTWFELKDDKATLSNKADAGYVKWAHDRGYKVWALVSNGFNPDWTRSMLQSFEMRQTFISQILHYSEMYNVDGINLDFENVYLEDKERLVQFVRELTPYLHEQGLTVSMDVTIKSTSDRWSRFYDRAALAKVVDYIAVMTYDEHWASSPVAGSVASLPWTEKGLQGVLEEVPNHKLLLGVPFYTRLWKEEKQPDGSLKVTSKALSMPAAEAWLKERGVVAKPDEKTGQLFASYVDPKDGATYKIWLEDKGSMQKRVELVHKYKLAGVAAWRRGFETENIWPAIDEGLKPTK